MIGCLTELTGPKIQIKKIDTKNQLVDMSTKGNFTHDEWDENFGRESSCGQGTGEARKVASNIEKNMKVISQARIYFDDTLQVGALCQCLDFPSPEQKNERMHMIVTTERIEPLPSNVIFIIFLSLSYADSRRFV